MKFFAITFLSFFISIACINAHNSFHISDSCLKRQYKLYSKLSIGYGTTMLGLYFAWYKDYPSSKFHFFNDNDQWLLMDKFGHAFSAYQLNNILFFSSINACIPYNKALLYNSLTTLMILNSIEVFDGFSSQWGASLGDVLANIAGVGVFTLQQYLFKKQILQIKFSYFPSRYPKYRPSLLGSNHLERTIKDYNAQVYWFSIAPSSIIKNNIFPKWLSIAFGYSINGMIAAEKVIPSDSNIPFAHMHNPQKQFYISPDIDWQQLHFISKLRPTLIFILNAVKLPLPSILFFDNKVKITTLAF